MESSPLVSVIIVNWNGARYLPGCLEALNQQTYSPLEIILVDNASTDDSRQIIEEYQASSPADAPKLTYVQHSKNEGFCRGNNRGIAESQGRFVLLLNADVTVESRFIEVLVKLINTDPTIGICVGKLLSGHEPTRIDSTGIVIAKNRRALDRGQGERDTGQYDRTEEVFGASGAACLYRRAMLEEIRYEREPGAVSAPLAYDEYLDELFFAYKEDVDLSWRARLCGWKCLYTSEALGRHFRTWGEGKRAAIPIWIRRHSLKNRYLMLLKNERWETLAPHLLSLLWYEGQVVVYLLFREQYLFSIYREILRHWPEVIRKRRKIQQQIRHRVSDTTLRGWFQ